VLSKSVADAFSYYNDPATTETEAFIRRMDRLFDCLNVRNHSEWQQKRKEDLKPYTSPDDSRLKVYGYVMLCISKHLIVAERRFLTVLRSLGSFSVWSDSR
jgi:hypothetical protein